MRICCVVPTIRSDCHAKFVNEWRSLFDRHQVTLITVWDGESPRITEQGPGSDQQKVVDVAIGKSDADLFCRFTDACRNLGFVRAAQGKYDAVFTADDDCYPPPPGLWKPDPIQAHLDALAKRVPLGWMNTAHQDAPYLRGVPYNIRDEAPVMLSHGVWVGTPDFDGETQLQFEKGTEKFPVPPYHPSQMIPYTLPYYVGPVPRSVLFPLCGMNVMVKAEALPHLYYAPMGADSGYPDLHRFADIFMGVSLKREFDRLGWACYTGASTVFHSRASDATKNYQQEQTGRKWMECVFDGQWVWQDERCERYWASYNEKRLRYRDLIAKTLGVIKG